MISMNTELLIFLIFSLVSCTHFNSESTEKFKDEIEFKILDERLYLVDSQISINVQVTNNTDTSFLMFSFESLHESLSKESYYANNNFNYPSGLAMFIHDKSGNRLEEQPLSNDYIDFDDLREMKKKSNMAYVDRMLLLKANATVSIPVQMDLKYYSPKPGEYSVYLIYYSGKNLYNFVSEEQVRSDEKKYNAKEFRGWLKSDTVKLIVE